MVTHIFAGLSRTNGLVLAYYATEDFSIKAGMSDERRTNSRDSCLQFWWRHALQDANPKFAKREKARKFNRSLLELQFGVRCVSSKDSGDALLLIVAGCRSR
jgi:hypothetical protein